MRKNLAWIVTLGGTLAVCCAHRATAQEVPPPEPAADSATDEKPKPDATNDTALGSRQRQVRERFADLERLLLRMAELTAPTDPARAALLRQAVAQSKQRDIDHQFEELVKLLSQERLSLAIKGQGEVQRDLARLLELLLSEDRTKKIETEKERIREYLKRVNKIIKDQKSVQSDTSRQGDMRKLADRQGELEGKTGELAEELKKDAAESQPDKDDQKPHDGDAEKGDSQPGDPKKDDSKKDDAEKKDKEPAESKEIKKGESKDSKPDEGDKPGESKDSQPGKGEQQKDQKPSGDKPSKDSEPKPGQPQDQPPMPGQPSQGEEQSGEQQQPQDNPAQKRLEQAQRRMQEAQEKLEQAKREDATDKQAQALKELEQAKADLEEILRQLREEEMARMLAMLESRFRKMLDAQIEVYEGTKRLDQVPEAQRDRDDEIESGRLGRTEAQIVVEADKCLAVLREEGSAVAFPEAVTGIRDDMQSVADRLAQAKVGEVTQAIETDIIAALEEMIAALKKAQKDMENKQQNQQMEIGDGEPPLVDVLAELKMIRALQMRVNVRTQRYAELTKQEQAETPELLDALKRLAEREQRIHKVTRDIVVGRNR
jgi:hypothetical protein